MLKKALTQFRKLFMECKPNVKVEEVGATTEKFVAQNGATEKGRENSDKVERKKSSRPDRFSRDRPLATAPDAENRFTGSRYLSTAPESIATDNPG